MNFKGGEMHHLTHIDNLENILNQGLKARNFLRKDDFKDTADSNIINKRKTQCGKDLNNYVPFHIDYLQKEHGIGYNYNVLNNYAKEDMCFIISVSNELKIPNTLYYMYHPTSQYFIEFNNYGDFSQKMNSEYKSLKGRDNRLDYSQNKVKQFLMSEILVPDFLKTKHIAKIIVYNTVAENKVNLILKNLKINNIVVEINISFFER